MGFGLLTKRMMECLPPFIADREVWDLGAGDLDYANTLMHLGAAHVIAIDKSDRGGALRPKKGIEFRCALFRQVEPPPEGIGVAFVSWPVTYAITGLVDLVKRADVVIYLGSNMGGSACGPRELFEHLGQRELLAHVPHRQNSLLVCGGPCERRTPTPEEYAALSGEMMSFYEATKRAPLKILYPLYK
jgi:hypothetical protein